MLKTRLLLLTGALLMWSFCARAQEFRSSDELFSPSAALKFYEIGYELANKTSANQILPTAQAQQALIFITAVTHLDNQSSYVLPEMIKLAAHTGTPLLLGLPYEQRRPLDVNDPNAKPALPQDNTELVRAALKAYVNSSADLDIAKQAVQYLLSHKDSREQKEDELKLLLGALRNKNTALESELASSLGLLAAERADPNTAQALFMSALQKNKYNRLAFAKLYEIASDRIPAVFYLEHLRYMLGENPLDIETAVAFADYAQQLQLFEIAADAFEYSASLYEYLYPQQPLPEYIYTGWALSSFNTERNPYKTIQIAEKINSSGSTNLMLDTIAAKAALKTGQPDKAKNILAAAEQTAIAKYQTIDTDRSLLTKQLAWFYCFGSPQPDLAIDWANKAYSKEPNNIDAAALLAYAFVLNNQLEWAKPFLEEGYMPNIILDLVKAKIALSEDNKNSATDTLKAIIDTVPASIEALEAREILKSIPSEYIPAIDPKLTEIAMQGTFGTTIVPAFRDPNSIMKIQLNIRGDKFSYGTDFNASLVLTNISTEPLVISDYGLFKGNIRIDAIVSGDIKKQITNLISKRILPSEPIKHNASLIVPLRLMTGELKETLTKYPQASMEIQFKVYFDPVVLPDGTVANRLEDLPPVTAKVKRPAVEITAQFLRNRMNTIKRERQSYRTAELFAGLLIEQQIMAQGEPLYNFMYADWMRDLLNSSIAYNLTSDSWDGRIHTMASLLPLPLDYELIEAVSSNLNHEKWPVRLMSIYLLAQNQTAGFKKVLDYAAKYDSYPLVRDMAVALGGTAPADSLK